MSIAVVPQNMDELGENTLFEFEEYDPLKPYGTDRVAFQRLKETFENEGVEVNTVDLVDLDEITACLFVDINYKYIYKLLSQKEKPLMIYIMREPPSVIPENSASQLIRLRTIFDHIVTWNSSLSKLDGFTEYNIPQYMTSPNYRSIDFKNQTLLTNISSRKYSTHPEELYTERESIIKFYNDNHPEKFNLYGQYWNRLPSIGNIIYDKKIRYNKYRVFRGLAGSKAEVYQRHRFAVCFENMTGVDGYLTEKLIDCFRSGIVPIYWGASDITDYVPPGTFIDYREFGSPQRLHGEIVSMGKERYDEYIDTAQEFLDTNPEPLTPDHYAKKLYKVVSSTEAKTNRSIPSELANTIRIEGEKQEFVHSSKQISFPQYLFQSVKTIHCMPTWRQKISAILESLLHRY